MNELMLAYGPRMIQECTVLGICTIRLYALMTLFPPTGSSVVTGTLRSGVFVANTDSLSTKCPSKYLPAKKKT